MAALAVWLFFSSWSRAWMRWSRGEVHGAAAPSSAAQTTRPVTRGANSWVMTAGMVWAVSP